ncbi:hypothetical protein [Glaciihabitans sp. dw_435]|uniref:hypothetical protein n=1 Tax=Glaciihabitans sp. dw_435 TaxID=2720081 RepID=UPI001BD697A3|nr:hypothetical protein [Glaciihabitans sp. dw_435]
MTLTHILPSLRRSLPDPMNRDRWPEFTVVSTTDVTVAGVSMLRLVDWCSTPCVHTAAAVIAGTHGRPSDTELASVVVVRVVAVGRSDMGGLTMAVDGELRRCHPVWGEIRLIGRASTAHDVPVTLGVSGADSEARDVTLPSDVRVGDLLAVPCPGATTLHDVRVPTT